MLRSSSGSGRRRGDAAFEFGFGSEAGKQEVGKCLWKYLVFHMRQSSVITEWNWKNYSEIFSILLIDWLWTTMQDMDLFVFILTFSQHWASNVFLRTVFKAIEQRVTRGSARLWSRTEHTGSTISGRHASYSSHAHPHRQWPLTSDLMPNILTSCSVTDQTDTAPVDEEY